MPFPPPDPTKIVYCPAQTPPPISANRFCRNGQYPDASLMGTLATAANQVANNRPKEIFRGAGDMTVTASGGTRNRWRFAGHTGPFLSALHVRFTAAFENDRTSGHNPFVKLVVANPAGTTTYGTASYYYGALNGSQTDAPAYFGTQDLTISGVPADTDIVGLFTDNDQSRLVSATVYEVSLLPTVANGYVPVAYHAMSPILDYDRSTIATLGKNVWKRGSRQLLNWCTDLDAGFSIINTTVNVVDQVSTLVTAATPGFKIDTTYDIRRSQTTVPIIIAMYGKCGAAGQTSSGAQLKNGSGTTVTVSGLPATTPGWVFATANMPATSDKWDLQFWNSSTSATLYAVSIFEYEA